MTPFRACKMPISDDPRSDDLPTVINLLIAPAARCKVLHGHIKKKQCRGEDQASESDVRGEGIVASITKRDRRRVLKSKTVVQTRFVVNFTDPQSGRRKQYFFEHLRDAQEKRASLLIASRRHHAPADHAWEKVRTGRSSPNDDAQRTVGDIVAYWLSSLDEGLKNSTNAYYHHIARYVVRPLPIGSTVERRKWARAGHVPPGVDVVEMLDKVPLSALTTAHIRAWHKTLVVQVGSHTANAAKKLLGAALARIAEDLGVHVPPMPRKLGKGKARGRKSILTPEQVGVLVKAACEDAERGLYYAFPFLTGVRPSEQLGLLWCDVDLERGVIRIRRMQELDGSLCSLTKTPAGNRELPISPLLRDLLARWQAASPTAGDPHGRVFTALGTSGSRRHARQGMPLTYANFRSSYWRPVFERLGLPYVSPHSARHTFISTLQANGIEVGLVAKLAGHANATVTLAHYTQAVRGGDTALAALEQAYTRAAERGQSGTPTVR